MRLNVLIFLRFSTRQNVLILFLNLSNILSPVKGENYPGVNNWGCFIKGIIILYLGSIKLHTPIEYPLTPQKMSFTVFGSFKFLRKTEIIVILDFCF